jgi:hypothetical protein
MEEKINGHDISVGKPEGRRPFQREVFDQLRKYSY